MSHQGSHDCRQVSTCGLPSSQIRSPFVENVKRSNSPAASPSISPSHVTQTSPGRRLGWISEFLAWTAW